MKKTIVCCLALLVSLGMVTPINSRVTEIDIAANLVHEELKELPKKLYKQLGFKSDQELKESSLGTPYAITMVGLKNLEQLGIGDDPNDILMDIKKIIYPVNVGSTLKSSITIVKTGSNWKPAAIGGWEMYYLELARNTLSNKLSREIVGMLFRPPPTFFVVRVPAMYMTFIGYRRNNILYLVPTHPHPDYTFILHIPISAKDVFIQLKPLVEKYKKVLIRSKVAVPDLIGLLKDPSEYVRRSAAVALGKLGSPRAVDPLIRSLPGIDKWSNRLAVIEALGKLGSEKALDAILPYLNSDSKHERRTVVQALHRIGSPLSKPALEAALKDPDREVRIYAAQALKKIKQKE